MQIHNQKYTFIDSIIRIQYKQNEDKHIYR